MSLVAVGLFWQGSLQPRFPRLSLGPSKPQIYAPWSQTITKLLVCLLLVLTPFSDQAISGSQHCPVHTANNGTLGDSVTLWRLPQCPLPPFRPFLWLFLCCPRPFYIFPQLLLASRHLAPCLRAPNSGCPLSAQPEYRHGQAEGQE